MNNWLLIRAAHNVAVLDPDVAESFKNSKVVHEALRNLLHVTDATMDLTPRSIGRGKKRSAA